ncbi:HK97 gp10 family phage protein [Listeria ilorinensis]|uniref:HK97 gp10 family phage protein n=1 Tax=Listeria ilorinensis TaxID=2867439 RepID=UPI001EF61962|nr:HK97 gp10 family phage protein [Listeria ilorinensis]
MPVTFTGTDDIIREMEKRYSPAKVKKAARTALIEGAEVVEKAMQASFNSFADTGASRDEIVFSLPRSIGGVLRIRLGWRGPKDRWRLIHLNENGYTRDGRRVTPRGYGTIRRTVAAVSPAFIAAVQESLRKQMLL